MDHLISHHIVDCIVQQRGTNLNQEQLEPWSQELEKVSALRGRKTVTEEEKFSSFQKLNYIWFISETWTLDEDFCSLLMSPIMFTYS